MKNNLKNIGIIMDGNRRWSKSKGLPIIKGYKQGIAALKRVIEASTKYKIKQLTVFAFSSENWDRSNSEVEVLLQLLEWYLKSEIAELHRKNIIFRSIGNKYRFPSNLSKLLTSAEDLTMSNTGLELNVALNYGGREDILSSVKSISKKVEKNIINLDDINFDLFRENLISSKVEDFDLLIRTSGEKRLSNFMFWQITYSEIYYSDVLWPDFNEDEFLKAIDSYKKRERRFGASSI